MSKRTLRKNLSIVVEPSHRLIIDDTDNNNGRLTGRVVLTNEPDIVEQPPLTKSSSSPAPSSLAFTPDLSTGTSSAGGSALPSIGSGVGVGFSPAIRKPSARNLKHLSLNLPSASSSMQSSPADASLPPSPLPLPAQSSFQLYSSSDHQLTSSPLPLPSIPPSAPSLAERRRRSSSAASVPALPAPLRPRTDSTISTTNPAGNIPSTLSSRPPSVRSSISRGGRAEEDGYGYTSSHAPTNNNTTTVGLAAPEPYLNGPIQILPGIWLGCEDNARDFASLKRCGIGYVLNVAKEITNIFSGEEDRKAKVQVRPSPLGKLRSSSNPVPSTPLPHVGTSSRTFHPADPTTGRPDIHYMHLAWSHGQSDLVTSGFPVAMTFTDEAIKKGKGVLIHCQCGVSRSATLVIALVMRAAQNPDAVDELQALKGSMHAAYAYVKEKSIAVGPNMSLIYQLLEYERHLSRKLTDQSAEESSVVPLAEDASTRSEEEEWGRMRKLMEEEEERERQERERGLQSAVDDSSDHFALHQHQHAHHFHQAQQVGGSNQVSNHVPVVNVSTYGTAPWAAGGSSNWNGYSLSNSSSGTTGGAPGRTGSVSGASSIISGPADDEEARDLDRQMEERVEVRRKSSGASFTSSVVSVSAASSASGGNSGATGVTPWKSRYGGHRPQRLRAGSIESNYTGHSMVSLEEEEEEEADELPKQFTASPESSNVPLPSLDLVDVQPLFRERTVSSSTHSSVSMLGLAADDDRDSEPFTSPPLDSETDAGSEQRLFLPPTTFPKAQAISLPPPRRNPKKLSLGGSIQEQGQLQLSGTSDSTPKVKSGLASIKLSAPPKSFTQAEALQPSAKPTAQSIGRSLSTDVTPLSPLSKPPAFRRLSTNGLPFATSSSLSHPDSAPPPSAPATKLSFGPSELTVPFPRRKPSGSSSHSSRSNGGSLKSSPLALPRPESSVKVKVSKKHLPELAMVPSSPIQPASNPPAPLPESTGVDQSLNSPMVNIFRQADKSKIAPVDQHLPKAAASVTPLASMLNAASRRRSASISLTRPTPPDPSLADAKKRPAPLPLQPSDDKKSEEPSAFSYILSSSRRRTHHRSSSSVSSLSSTSSRSSSQSSLRDKLLSRFMGGRSSSPPPSQIASSTPLTATPHQTLFIFPPSPTSHTTGKHGSQTPSTLTVTTTTGGTSNPASSYFPLLTPTPTLSSFRMSRTPSFSGRGSLPTNSSFPAAIASNPQSGWMGSAQMTPTTACSRVDVRGWVGI